MQKVYLLYHNRHGVNKNISYINIGIFTSYELAEAAKNRVKDKPGFIDYPNDFYIDEYIIDKDDWENGFID